MIQNLSIKLAERLETHKMSEKPLQVQVIQEVVDSQVNLHEVIVHRSIFITQCAYYDWEHGTLADVDINEPLKLDQKQV